MAVARQVTILSFPSDDETLRRLVEDLLNDPAIVSPAGLETRLRPVYPQLAVRERGLAGERAETWYVYRARTHGQPLDIEHREELTPTGMRSFVHPVAIAQRAVA